jgi:hypothetical protein
MPVILETIDAIARRRDRLAYRGEDWLGPLFRVHARDGDLRGRPECHSYRRPVRARIAAAAQAGGQFEHPDGLPQHPDLVLSLLRLETAMVNADQDEPGFWDDF